MSTLSPDPRAGRTLVGDERGFKRRHRALVLDRADGDEEGLGFARGGIGDDILDVRALAFDAVVRVHVQRGVHARNGRGITDHPGGEDEVIVLQRGAVAEDDLLAFQVERRHVGVQQHGHPGELRPALAQIPRGRRSVDAPRPRVLPRASNREPRLGVDDGDGDARRVLRVREGLGASEAAEAGADDDDVLGHRVIRERKNVR